MEPLRIKVCGMRDEENIEQLVALKPDYIGFIFYPKSKRYVGVEIDEEISAIIPAYILKVGVFVDEQIESILDKFQNNLLDLVQLHGKELPKYCEQLKRLNIPVIKVFNVDDNFDFAATVPYEPFCTYFLFDTGGKTEKGGTGEKFNWSLLTHYKGKKPFFLSGGIDPEDADTIKTLAHPALYAIDVNSGFETEPGVKDIPLLHKFVAEIRGL
jgi:phosphoribosylanthranilate isomerase